MAANAYAKQKRTGYEKEIAEKSLDYLYRVSASNHLELSATMRGVLFVRCVAAITPTLMTSRACGDAPTRRRTSCFPSPLRSNAATPTRSWRLHLGGAIGGPRL